MNKDCTSAMYEILSRNEVSGDCKHVILCIIGSTKSPDKMVMADLFGENEASEDYNPPKNDAEEPLKDERLRAIQLVNIRSFYGDKSKRNENFGLNFSVKDYPVSLFLVGGNSTGKSSIFSALEKYYTGIVSYAKSVNCNETSYMTFGFGSVKKLDVGYIIESGSQKGKWESLQNNNDITTSASFCSDYDIERIEKSNDNLNEFILEQLGYGDLFLLRNQIEFLLTKLKDKYKINEKDFLSSEWTEIIEAFIIHHKNISALGEIKSFSNISMIEKAISQGEKHNVFSSRWDMLIKGNAASFFKRQNNDSGYADYFFSDTTRVSGGRTSKERLSMMYEELYKRIKELDSKNVVDVLDEMYMCKNAILEKERRNAEMLISSDNRKETLSTVLDLIKDKCNQILSNIYKDSHIFIEDILKRFSPPNESYCFNYEDGKVYMSIVVETEKGTFPAYPQYYLNTFRFKLYCVTLKIALALSKMKERRISVPIVIDDIFNASDFENTLKLEQFVYTIFKTYDEVLRDKTPLQLILLTHDEMVQGAFRRGIKLRLEENGRVQSFQNDTYREYFLCGRLFDKRDWTEYISSTKWSNPNKFINLYIEN